jgi:toxin ParE1/3/4
MDSPPAAEKAYRAIISTASRLADFPEMGRLGGLPDPRALPVIGLPYLIVHGVATEVVTILAVFHTSQDLARAFGEHKTRRNS